MVPLALLAYIGRYMYIVQYCRCTTVYYNKGIRSDIL
jgi:hypothetical protein